MTSRERVAATLRHEEPDKVPLDLGGCAVTGIHASCLYKLRQRLGLDAPGTPVKVHEPYQMLGTIEPDLMDAIGIDVVGLISRKTLFGFENRDWKEWRLFDGTPVLVPGEFNTTPEPDGSIFQYPEGDTSVLPSGKMPKNGFYFDAIVRSNGTVGQAPIDDDMLRIEDNLEEFGPISDEDLSFFEHEAERLFVQTDKAILATFGGTAFGDIALVPAVWLKDPKGIRGIAEWYMSTAARRDFVYAIFEKQCEIALQNLAKIHDGVGDRVAAIYVTGTDFGTQQGLFISRRAYRDLFLPFHKEVNSWIHSHTGWKSFIHSCGSVVNLLPDFVEAGFDIVNPVQCSAEGMDPAMLKSTFGRNFTFWGGGIDTQRTLPFGTPAEVADQVKARLETFAPGGGFVFNTVHNIQANVPIENVIALFASFNENRNYGHSFETPR